MKMKHPESSKILYVYILSMSVLCASACVLCKSCVWTVSVTAFVCECAHVYNIHAHIMMYAYTLVWYVKQTILMFAWNQSQHLGKNALTVFITKRNIWIPFCTVHSTNKSTPTNPTLCSTNFPDDWKSFCNKLLPALCLHSTVYCYKLYSVGCLTDWMAFWTGRIWEKRWQNF